MKRALHGPTILSDVTEWLAVAASVPRKVGHVPPCLKSKHARARSSGAIQYIQPPGVTSSQFPKTLILKLKPLKK
jgi:hypothetical protein